MYSLQIDTRLEQICIGGKRHGREIAAVRATPDAATNAARSAEMQTGCHSRLSPKVNCEVGPPSAETPSVRLATQIDQGCTVRFRSGSGGPPSPGRRTKAMERPSADQRGELSLSVEAARYRSGWSLEANIPMKA